MTGNGVSSAGGFGSVTGVGLGRSDRIFDVRPMSILPDDGFGAFVASSVRMSGAAWGGVSATDEATGSSAISRASKPCGTPPSGCTSGAGPRAAVVGFGAAIGSGVGISALRVAQRKVRAIKSAAYHGATPYEPPGTSRRSAASAALAGSSGDPVSHYDGMPARGRMSGGCIRPGDRCPPQRHL